MTQQVPAGKIRCPNCGALNSEGAEWCGQCLQRFRAPEPPPPPRPVGAPPTSGTTTGAEAAGPVTTSSEVADDHVAVDPAAVGTKRGAFEVTEEGIRWTCRVCETRNPIEATVCSACGSPFAETVLDKREDQITGDPNNAALYSLFFPGAGHAYLGLWGDAIFRGILSTFAVVVTAVSFIGDARPVAFVFGILSFVLWLVAAHDAYREASHQSSQTLIKTRHYGFIMLGVLGLLFLMLMVMYLGLRAQR